MVGKTSARDYENTSNGYKNAQGYISFGGVRQGKQSKPHPIPVPFSLFLILTIYYYMAI
jgi:hypothetical protein